MSPNYSLIPYLMGCCLLVESRGSPASTRGSIVQSEHEHCSTRESVPLHTHLAPRCGDLHCNANDGEDRHVGVSSDPDAHLQDGVPTRRKTRRITALDRQPIRILHIILSKNSITATMFLLVYRRCLSKKKKKRDRIRIGSPRNAREQLMTIAQ